ncbi:MAG: hypothetical protein KC636_36700 [Myxococcales bacterium]|nr:hypothetical protein [Myxococcales bacterium]
MALAGLVACGGGDEREDATSGVTTATTEASTTAATGAQETEGSTGVVTTTTGETGAASDWTATDAETEADTSEEAECDYELVYLDLDAALWITPAHAHRDVRPLEPGEGFFCMRVEFDLQTLDNLDAIAAEHDACPAYLGLASIFGSAATGDVMATAFLRHRDELEDGCAAGEPRAEVGNYLNYTEEVPGPWPPGQAWHVTLEAKPWVTRLTLAKYEGGGSVGPAIEADLYPANVADTRDPVVRLGQPMIVEGRYFPWFGATYANLEVWADVAAPE